jgi:hypothetical protein
VQKKTGSLTGWIGYTLSWTDRRFDQLNNGEWYPYKYDRRHDVSIAMTHDWNKKRDFSAAWVFGTGNAITLPISHYYAPGQIGYGFNQYHSDINYYGSRNSFRMRAYHRLDLSFSFIKQKKWGERRWTIGVYNAYNRRNPFYMDLGYSEDGRRRVFYQYSLFPVIPSVAYSFKF